MSIEIQAITLLLMVVCGMIMGLLYDTYRVMKGQTGIRGWLVIICDLLFWASCLFLVFGTLLRVNDGIVSVYLFLGMGLGAWLYFSLFTSFYKKWFLRFIHLVKTISRFFARLFRALILKPVLFIYQTSLAFLIAAALFIWRAAQFVYRLCKKAFAPLGSASQKWGKKTAALTQKKGAGLFKRLVNLFKSRRRKDD